MPLDKAILSAHGGATGLSDLGSCENIIMLQVSRLVGSFSHLFCCPHPIRID